MNARLSTVQMVRQKMRAAVRPLLRFRLHRAPRPALLLTALTVFTAACSIDALLEADVPQQVHLSMAVGSNVVTSTPGSDATLTASITRLDTFQGEVTFSLLDLPNGVVADIGAPVTSGKVTTTTITFHVGADVPVRDYLVNIRGKGGTNGVTSAEFTLKVLAVPSIGLTLTQSSLSIIRGGTAPNSVSIARTSAPDPVTLSLTGTAGISLQLATNPVTGNKADFSVVVAPTVAAGTYTLSLHGTSSGVSEREVPLTVVVTSDPLQLIVSNVTTVQATAVSVPILVNRNGDATAVTFSATGLPAGVTATFDGGSASSSSGTVNLVATATSSTGTYQVTLHARSEQGSETSTLMGVSIGVSNVAFTLSPPTITVLQGSSAATTVNFTRTAFTGGILVQGVNVPAGLSVSVSDPLAMGNSTIFAVAADPAVSPGAYSFSVRAAPAPAGGPGTPALDPALQTITVNVLEAPPSSGNVLLDWSRCAPPEWVAVVDGSGPWQTITGTQGLYRFTINSGRGAFAYTEGGKQLTIRFGTSAELSAKPIDLCPAPPQNVRTVIGTAIHSSATETFTWRYGGGSGTSTLAFPNFTITGVRDGMHDLVGVGVSSVYGQRLHISRDVNAQAGETVGTVSLIGQNAFSPISGTYNVPGFVSESRSTTISYLTGPSCDVNELYQLAAGAITGTAVFTMLGVPPVYQRPDDYHLIETSATGANGRRTITSTFHSITSTRTQALPAALLPTVTSIAGSYQRLRLFFSQQIATTYNGLVTLQYSDGIRTTKVIASVAVLGTGTTLLDTPDLGTVSGFPTGAALPTGATGTWTVSVTGSNGQAVCSEEALRWSFTKSGSF